MAKTPENPFSTSETSPSPLPNSRPLLSPELSPKNGSSELGFSFDESEFPPDRSLSPKEIKEEINEIKQSSEAVCRSAQESLREFRSSSASVKRKILSMERQITSLKGSFADVGELGSKSSVRDEVNLTHETGRAQQLTVLMRELQAVQELLQEKELEFERREEENRELKVALTRLEVLVGEAVHRRAEYCECHRCELL